MNNLKLLLDQLIEAGSNPKETVLKSMQDTKKEAVGCFPIYTPEEIIYAAGYLPVGMWGGPTDLKLADKYLQGFCCSIMRSNIEYGMKGTYNFLKAVVISTFCDTLKCICENWKVAVPEIPVIPVVYPQNRMIEAGKEYLNEEFKRVATELEKLSGKVITEDALNESFEIYEDFRAAMREFTVAVATHLNTIDVKTRHLVIKASFFMDKKTYTLKIKEITNELNTLPKEDFDGIKVIATGLIAEPTALLDILVENNIGIIDDDLSQESRGFRVVARKEDTVYEKMVGRIVDQRGCTFLFEEAKTRGAMLIEMVNKHQADAVLVIMMKFCDPEEFDYPIYKEEIENNGIPILYVETEQQMDSAEQIRTRIQSFAEMLTVEV
ncbi:MAG TPA: 2-hydroxyacyl-CoA dehydratase family protein [Anaerovoracaceae bacterium]|nr:2-hydroxyacyl-CoA dehydratase family protein [Anaerovoracaceae bacterium]